MVSWGGVRDFPMGTPKLMRQPDWKCPNPWGTIILGLTLRVILDMGTYGFVGCIRLIIFLRMREVHSVDSRPEENKEERENSCL